MFLAIGSAVIDPLRAMNDHSPASVKVLVVADNPAESTQLVEKLLQHFTHVESATRLESVTLDFKCGVPTVLVLAFRELQLAERFFLGLPRSEALVRAVVLCGKEDTSRAFELCRQGNFEDYVLQWPNPQDGLRLTMSVWCAARALSAAQSPTAVDEQAVAAEQPAAPDGADDASMLNVRRRRKILVVDDDVNIGMALSHILADSDYDLCLANGRIQALQKLEQGTPEVILMDIHLDRADGIALMREMKLLPSLSAVPVIMLTGDARRETLLDCIAAGCADFLAKPFTHSALRQKIEKAVLDASATKPMTV